MALNLELAVRLAAFASVFGLMAGWEFVSPARTPRLPRALRWRANLGLALVNTLLLRVALPTSAIALAALSSENGWATVTPGTRLSTSATELSPNRAISARETTVRDVVASRASSLAVVPVTSTR